MIKINLANKKQSSVGKDTKWTQFDLNSVGKTSLIVLEEIKEIRVPIIRISCLALIIYLGLGFLTNYEEILLQEKDREVKKIIAESTKLSLQLEKTKGYDAIKKSLEEDEALIRSKIETVKKLIADRAASPKLLLAISKAIPEEVWLTDISIQETTVSLKGSAIDFNQISDFMKNLNESVYFKDLDLKNTQQAKIENNFDIAQFELSANRRLE